MYIARFQCGGLAAIQPDDITDDQSIVTMMGRWYVRGWVVERIERFRGHPIQNMRCGNKACADCYKVVDQVQTL